MFWAIAGIVLAGIGAATSAIGQARENESTRREAEMAAAKRREQIPLLQQQIGVYRAGQGAAAEEHRVQELALTYQGLDISRAGREATGQVRAAGGVGNLGGISPLRNIQRIQTQTNRQLAFLGERAEVLDVQYEAQTLATEARIAQTEFDIRWAGMEAAEYEEQADWLERWGWLSVLGSALPGAGQVAKGIGSL